MLFGLRTSYFGFYKIYIYIYILYSPQLEFQGKLSKEFTVHMPDEVDVQVPAIQFDCKRSLKVVCKPTGLNPLGLRGA